MSATRSSHTVDGSVEAGAMSPADRARQLLETHGHQVSWSQADDQDIDGLTTRLMDLFRTTASAEVFESLVEIARSALMRRVQSRIRFLGDHFDPDELLQDAIINIYRYPDRFDASRPGAFRAWSSTIVDNTIRRHLRKSRSGPDIALSPTEILAQHPDLPGREPSARAAQSEDFSNTVAAYQLFLQYYLAAYQTLSERERFVLQMVEVRRMRYAQLAAMMGIRPEALKMVVFRARKRITERIDGMMPAAQAQPRQGPVATRHSLIGRKELALAS